MVTLQQLATFFNVRDFQSILQVPRSTLAAQNGQNCIETIEPVRTLIIRMEEPG